MGSSRTRYFALCRCPFIHSITQVFAGMPSWHIFLVSWMLLIAVLGVIARGGFYGIRRHHGLIPGTIILTNYTNTLLSATSNSTSSTIVTSTFSSTTPTYKALVNSTTSIASGTSSPTPALPPTTTEPSSNLQNVYDRRVQSIVNGLTGLSSIPTW